jgi:hypothetical protein
MADPHRSVGWVKGALCANPPLLSCKNCLERSGGVHHSRSWPKLCSSLQVLGHPGGRSPSSIESVRGVQARALHVRQVIPEWPAVCCARRGYSLPRGLLPEEEVPEQLLLLTLPSRTSGRSKSQYWWTALCHRQDS